MASEARHAFLGPFASSRVNFDSVEGAIHSLPTYQVCTLTRCISEPSALSKPQFSHGDHSLDASAATFSTRTIPFKPGH